MSDLEIGLLITVLISLLGNFVTINGWVYNRNRKEELEKQLIEIRRKHEVKDREIKAFRNLGEGFVKDITEVLSDMGKHFLDLTILSDIKTENESRYVAGFLEFNKQYEKLQKIKSGPDYQRFKRFLPDHLKDTYESLFKRLPNAVASFAESMEVQFPIGNYDEVNKNAQNVLTLVTILSTLISVSYSQLEETLIDE